MSANTEHNRPRSEYSTSDLGELLNDLYSVCPKWKILGIQLGLPEEELELIRADNDITQECLFATLSRRLKQ